LGDKIAQLILEKILKAIPEEMKNLSEMIRGNQGFDSPGIDEILSTTTISLIKAIKFYPELCQCIRSKALQED
jgi:hypothetical protein